MKKEIVKNCMDSLAGFDLCEWREQKQTLISVIDVLRNYPKPHTKKEICTNTKNLGAYLFISNSRNACKLCINGFIGSCEAYQLVSKNLESALSLLID
ncbi:hypothetical protein LG651_02645 [Tamlana sp. 62-3]|uniref:Uncharacterized protein n=1 Tax=Neotamlana sargassicola TaxID=2883125 RepID=A0A9X1I5M8_9FLAO|nr:hypothetical protein [Tamlana sargassicola]MCB4807134.1 hypothetical protein [Tamlana sargassicola]